MPPLSSPPNNLVSSTNQILRPAPRRLSCMKVSELKNECKKRNLPVSGPKPHLVDRLRIYEREILGCTPAPSPEPSETSLPSVVNGASSTSQSVMMIDNQNGGMVSEANTLQATSGIISCSSSSIPQSMQEVPSRPAQLTIHDYLTSQNQRSLVLLPPSGQQVVQV
ncbi:hypothetical protein WR25_16897 [Diploscapter pachys]|uniref:SAP domain-containing protein n=1 Tax=Diploscapter pachys TaxID=2018661 RepID=A0A2A2LKC2_9BILA|nr:hypothetical protein WR25_16897 [Diploscapter pachys]